MLLALIIVLIIVFCFDWSSNVPHILDPDTTTCNIASNTSDLDSPTVSLIKNFIRLCVYLVILAIGVFLLYAIITS